MTKLTKAQRAALEAVHEQYKLAVLERVTMASFIAANGISMRTWSSLVRCGYAEVVWHDGWPYPFITPAGREALEVPGK